MKRIIEVEVTVCNLCGNEIPDGEPVEEIVIEADGDQVRVYDMHTSCWDDLWEKGEPIPKTHQCPEEGCAYSADSRTALGQHTRRVHGKGLKAYK